MEMMIQQAKMIHQH